MANIGQEVVDYLIDETLSVDEGELFYGQFPASPLLCAALYDLGGETEALYRFRVMSRASNLTDAMELAVDIYEELHRLTRTDLTTVHSYMVTGQRPQQSGRDQEGNFFTSSDYVMEYVAL